MRSGIGWLGRQPRRSETASVMRARPLASLLPREDRDQAVQRVRGLAEVALPGRVADPIRPRSLRGLDRGEGRPALLRELGELRPTVAGVVDVPDEAVGLEQV